MKAFHECELKFYMNHCDNVERLTGELFKLGYQEHPEGLETDYIFDSDEKVLRKEKILFRVRSLVIKEREELFFTVKTKGSSSAFQDSLEFETCTSNPNHEVIQDIITIIRDRVGFNLPDTLFSLNSTQDILHNLSTVGFEPFNIVQKKRKEFSGKKAKVLIDRFPMIEGCFIEVEASSENTLFEAIQELGLDASASDKRNYGQIIAEMTNNAKILKFNM